MSKVCSVSDLPCDEVFESHEFVSVVRMFLCVFICEERLDKDTHRSRSVLSVRLILLTHSQSLSDLLVFGEAAHDGGIHDAVEQHGEGVYG